MILALGLCSHGYGCENPGCTPRQNLSEYPPPLPGWELGWAADDWYGLRKREKTNTYSYWHRLYDHQILFFNANSHTNKTRSLYWIRPKDFSFSNWSNDIISWTNLEPVQLGSRFNIWKGILSLIRSCEVWKPQNWQFELLVLLWNLTGG